MKIIVGIKPCSHFPGTLHEPNFKEFCYFSEVQIHRTHLQEDLRNNLVCINFSHLLTEVIGF